jgi:hypothetical protein
MSASKDVVLDIIQSLASNTDPDMSTYDAKRFGEQVKNILDKNTDDINADVSGYSPTVSRAKDVALYNGLPAILSTALTTVICYFWDMPTEVAVAMVVIGGFVGNFFMHVVLPLFKKNVSNV